jgi:hypothetical protein
MKCKDMGPCQLDKDPSSSMNGTDCSDRLNDVKLFKEAAARGLVSS